jgi:hypothetical protein
MRLVFDTNVYIAALKASGYCAQLLNLVVDSQSGYELWASPFILDELERKSIPMLFSLAGNWFLPEKLLWTDGFITIRFLLCRGCFIIKAFRL